MTTTTDLAKFGQSELKELELLLTAMREHGLPKGFDSDGVVPMFNMDSGYVFLTNDQYEAAMLCDGKLEKYYDCPECGCEGFASDFIDINNHHLDNIEERDLVPCSEQISICLEEQGLEHPDA